MLNRLKQILKGNKEPEHFEWTGTIKPQDAPSDTVYLDPFSDEAANLEKGEFLPDMTEDDLLEFQRLERDGWKHFPKV